jgi:hypothetical protein
VVIDTESGSRSLGQSHKLAEVLRAQCIAFEDLQDSDALEIACGEFPATSGEGVMVSHDGPRLTALVRRDKIFVSGVWEDGANPSLPRNCKR